MAIEYKMKNYFIAYRRNEYINFIRFEKQKKGHVAAVLVLTCIVFDWFPDLFRLILKSVLFVSFAFCTYIKADIWIRLSSLLSDSSISRDY